MHLPGRLSATTLGDLLGALFRDGVSGLLELREVRGPRGLSVPGRVHRIHLRGGLVAAVDTPLSPPATGTPGREQIRARLDVLFALEEATLAFYTARPLAHVVHLGPGEFLHGRPRARDRLRGRASATAPAPTPEPPRSGVRPLLDDARARACRLLGLPAGAGAGEARRAFRRLAITLHPDRLGAVPVEQQRLRAARFAELSAAYHLLVA
jgi:hypothetical protein